MYLDGTLSSENQETFCIHFPFSHCCQVINLPMAQTIMSAPAYKLFVGSQCLQNKIQTLWLDVQSPPQSFLKLPITAFLSSLCPRIIHKPLLRLPLHCILSKFSYTSLFFGAFIVSLTLFSLPNHLLSFCIG